MLFFKKKYSLKDVSHIIGEFRYKKCYGIADDTIRYIKYYIHHNIFEEIILFEILIKKSELNKISNFKLHWFIFRNELILKRIDRHVI